MDTWRSDTGDDDGEVVDLLSVDDYDAYKAKVQASLSWVLHKAYEDQVPKEFMNPFYERAEGNWQIKPRLANLLANSELYCQACRNMFGENASQWQGHWSIIQVLSRKGIYAVGTGTTDVTETILMQTSPFKIKAHIALIDALMLAFSREIITIERVTQCVRRFTTFNASSELPSDLEDAILFWINKVCVTVQQNLEKTQTGPDGSDTSLKDPMATPREGISVPVMENFMSDVGDGCCLAVLLSFYCPQIVKLEDVYLQSVVGIADSLYNLRLIRSFCDKYIPNKTCHFTYEDLLYTKEPLKENFLVMVSELFYWFEIRPLLVVTGGRKIAPPVSGEGDGQQPVSTGKQQSFTSVKVPNVPISSITKQSFQRLKGDSELRSSSTPDIHKMSPSAPVAHRAPLLHKRHQQGQSAQHDDHALHAHSASVHRAHSLTSKDLKTGSVPRESVLAWQDRGHTDELKQEVGADTNLSGSNLLANVSIDSEMNGSFSSGSIDLGDLEPTPRTDRTDQTYTKPIPDNVIQFSLQNQQQIPQDFSKQHTPYPGDMQVESVTSERSDVLSQISGSEEVQRGDNINETIEEFDTRGVNHVEPLMPARLKPLKEKSNISTKEEERGDDFPKRKVPSPPQLKKAVGFNPEVETIDKSIEISQSDSTVSDGQITPLPEDQISPRDNFTPDSQSVYVNNQGFNNVGKPVPKKFEAFFVRGSLTESQDTSIASHRSDLDDAFAKESFTIPDQIHTPEAARAAGIPIIDSSEHPLLLRQTSREGSIGSSRSSGDFSDHESRKIHFDHKTRESVKTEPGYPIESSHINIKSPGQYIIQKPVIVNRRKDEDKNIKPNATNFAAIKQLKEFGNVDNSGLIYMQHGQEKEGQKSPLKEALQKNKVAKKTTFAPLPNQRTWQQSLATSNQNQDSTAGASDAGTASQELLKIKMKLEEKRKAIERKKHTQEIQQQKMRQRLGKAAFMHVIAKPKEEEEDELEAENTGRRPASLVPSRMTTSDPQVQVEPRVSKVPERNVMNTSDSSAKQVTPRRFSRDDIQQTIENVKTKWFNGDDTVSSRIQNEELSQQRTESPERSRTRRSLSVESREPEVSQRIGSKGEPDTDENPETYGEYNNSLDKLNQSLTDLQGEIMRLSLKQKQAGQPADKAVNNEINRQNKNDNSVNESVRSHTPPNVLEVKSKVESPRVTETGRPRGAQMRSSSEPRQIVSEQVPEEQIGNYQSHTLPRQPTYQHNQVSPYMMQGHVAGPAGPVYSNPNQFVPIPGGTGMVPTPQQYGSYLMGPTPGQMGQIPPQQITPPYQQSPPHMYPQTVSMYGQPFTQQNIISPQSQPYPTMYATQPQPQYQPHPHLASTYTTASHPQHAPYTQPMTVTQQPEPVVNNTTYTQVQNRVPTTNQTVFQDTSIESKVPCARKEPDNSKNVTENRTQDQDGFFISMHENSPRRQKTQISSDQKSKIDAEPVSRIDKTDNSVISGNRQPEVSNVAVKNSYDSSVIADFAQKIADKPPEHDRTKEVQPSTSQTTDLSQISNTSQAGQEETESGVQDTSVVGFVIGQDESMLDQSAEIEMQKKKDKILQMRLRRQEEQEVKRQKKEQELQRKREAERLKQEESERRKSEEKARREQIFRQYIEKKEEDEEGVPRKREEKAKQKPRPKSMFVRAGPGANLDEGLENSASTEDLSARNLTVPSSRGSNSAAYFFSPDPVRRNRSRGPRSKHPPSPSRTMRKAVSCNMLDQKPPGDGKSLAFGGLTHRRPPSPDLNNRTRKGPRSNESSESGSATGVPVGVDYTGPKLFVKPSAKSNRHIIINAISHCCLAGSVNTDQKNKVLEEIAKSNAKHFLILFRDASCGYRGLYGFDPDTEDTFKLVGVGPRTISNSMIERYYKYNSGAKSFSEVSSTKHVSVSIDALVLQNSVWKPAKAPAKGYR